MVAINASSIEAEPMTASSKRQPSTVLGQAVQLIVLVKLYTRKHPFITSCIAAFGVFLLFLVFVLSFRKPVERNQLLNDYSKIDMNYTFKAAKISHWCLWGGDEQCSCDPFTEPVNRAATKDWSTVQQTNVERIDPKKAYDVVFYGCDDVEGWNGQHFGMSIKSLPRGQDQKIQEYFVSNFTKAGGGKFEGVALGIAGDVAPNLLWRLRHGELPKNLNVKVFYLSIGMNDMVRGGCSEEAAFLGILRVAEEIHFTYPKARIVIQGLLPWSRSIDGSLDPIPEGFHPFKKKKYSPTSVKEAMKTFSYWPSIQHINAELEKFCDLHDRIVFFDVSALFLGSVGNQYYQASTEQIITALLYQGKRLTYEGYVVLGNVIQDALSEVLTNPVEKNFKAKPKTSMMKGGV